MSGDNNHRNIGLTADIVAAFVANNAVPLEGLPDLIASVNSALNGLELPVVPVQAAPEPAVNPKRSVTPNFIVCLEDGKKFRSLKRHLGSRHGTTPDAYRAKWSLPADYPMTAPNYAAKRSELAKLFGLGVRSVEAPAEKPPARKVPAKRPSKA
ncbi:MucR family transcriptional regulator [Mesorhizobium sp. AR10]|uniref:MucR family transcriptional regulator n=1 Tax=Mesorhizobium sp. AR10 TaxID=2865839 RepID=UPI00215F2EF9|nr:MucR family transcriptional regulator [Mesorhizobium sp. AR10]UVK37657.1 MucR family transcriptional regulator [Mesorhizobium sp. AR10]